MIDAITMLWANTGMVQSLIAIAAVCFVLYTLLAGIVSLELLNKSDMGILKLLLLSGKVGVLFSMLTVACFWGAWHLQYSKMTESDFNAKVVANVKDFRGSAECNEAGLHVKGVYALQDVSLDDNAMAINVELDNTFTDMKGACAQQKYLNTAKALDDILKGVADNTVAEQQKAILTVMPKNKPQLNVAKSGVISVNVPTADVNTQTLAVAVGNTSVVVSSTSTPPVPQIPPARPAPDVSKNISGQ